MVKVIVNPAAGAFKEHEWRLHAKYKDSLVFTEPGAREGFFLRPANLASIVRDIEDEVILAGGDGHIHIFVDEVIRQGYTLPKVRIIPIGTGNDFSLNIGIRNVAHAFQNQGHYKEANILQVDVYSEDGLEETLRFLNMVDVGYGAYLLEWMEQNPEFKARHGQKAYERAVLPSYSGYSHRSMVLRAGEANVHYDNVVLPLVMNGNYGGGGLLLGKDQSPFDGSFGVTVGHQFWQGYPGLLHVVPVLLKASRGDDSLFLNRRVDTHHVAEATFEAPQGRTLGKLLNADGELYVAEKDITRLEFSVYGKLSVYVPR